MRHIKKRAPANHSDFGPGLHVIRGGKLASWNGAAEIVVDDVDDTTVYGRPTKIRRARRRNAMFDLLQRGAVERRHYAASEQYLDDLSLAAGAASGADLIGMPAASGPRTALPERQVAALSRTYQVRDLLGLTPNCVFWHIIINNGSLTDFDARHKLPRGQAKTMLLLSLDRLDEHYHRAPRRLTD